MKQPNTHHLVDFASRYARTHFKTLNAASALWRAESLQEDAEALGALKQEAEDKGIAFGSGRTAYEILSYYAVGYVTCLEWHARSRLVDTMLFRPSFIQTSDVKKIADLALSQMMAEGVTVPHLLGAATHISTIEEYVEVFKRVFNALGITDIIENELRKAKAEIVLFGEDADNNLYNVLGDLFRTRNDLVHEINMSVIGHYTLRDTWSPSTAIDFGRSVVATIKLVEAKITQHAPKDFPNRIGPDGYAEDELEKLKAAIVAVQTELTIMLSKEEFASTWQDALNAGITSQEMELGFIDEAEFLRPVRHLDMRRSVQIDYLKARLAYLTLLKSEAEQSYGPF